MTTSSSPFVSHTNNYLIASYRHFKNNVFFGLLNIAGLVIGLTGAIVLFIFIASESSFNKFHQDHRKIYRITTVFRQDGYENKFAINEGLWDDVLENNIPGVIASTAFSPVWGGSDFVKNGEIFHDDSGLFTDKDFLKVFGFRVMSGTRDFENPNSIMITRALANKIFGSEDVIDRMLEWKPRPDTLILLKVSAILEDIPINSSLKMNYIIPGRLNGRWWTEQFNKTNRNGNTLHIYFRTLQEESIEKLQTRVDLVFNKNKPGIAGFEYLTNVQRFDDVHFNSDNQFELSTGGNKSNFKIFIILTLAFICIAAFNSMNINSIRFVNRAKELAIRKLLGGKKKSIIVHLISQSILTTVIVGIFAFLAATLTLRWLDLSVFSIDKNVLFDASNITTTLLGCVLLGIIISLLPILRVTSAPISLAIKGKVALSRQKFLSPRNSSVLLQVVTGVAALTFSLVMSKQIKFVNNMDLGYNKENLLCYLKPTSVPNGLWKTFQTQLLSYSNVSAVGNCSNQFLGLSGMSTAQFSPKSNPPILAVWNKIDERFIETMNMTILQGRAISAQHLGKNKAIVINETAKKDLGPNISIGSTLKSWMGEFEIVAVVKDFYFKPFNNKISPMVMIINNDASEFSFVRYTPGSEKLVLTESQRIWKSLQPGLALDYKFFGETFGGLIQKERQSSMILIFFTAICLALTGVGLIGLLGYTTSEYRNEIALRKILGGSVGDILKLLGFRFALLFLIGVGVGSPISVLLSRYWLSDFVYKTSITVGNVCIPALIILVCASIVVFRQVLMSAMVNPLREIKNE